MKHSKSHEQCLLLHYTNEDEKEVANILLDLESLVRENQYRFQYYSLIWGSKKRRSNRGAESSSRVNSSPSLQGSSKVDEHEFEHANTKIKAEFNSPATPLSFSPSESDENSKHSSRKSSKRKTREELMDMIKQLSQCRESLRGEVENIRNYYNNQKTYNLKLKAMKEQVTRMLNVQGASIDNLGQLYSNRQQPFIMDQVALGSEAFHGFQYPLGQTTNGLGPVNHAGLGPIGLPDLNITVDETFTLDSLSPFDLERMNVERKVQFAEARRKRRIKRIQIKNASGFIRPPRRT